MRQLHRLNTIGCAVDGEAPAGKPLGDDFLHVQFIFHYKYCCHTNPFLWSFNGPSAQNNTDGYIGLKQTRLKQS